MLRSSRTRSVFAAPAIGATPADARVLQNKVLPLRVVGPVVGKRVTIEPPALAADVPESSNLYLLLSPTSDMSFGHGSRVPGAVVFEDVVVRYRTA